MQEEEYVDGKVEKVGSDEVVVVVQVLAEGRFFKGGELARHGGGVEPQCEKQEG